MKSLFSLTRSLAVRCSDEKENNFYSSDSDFDDEEPKKFHIQIRPVASSNRSNPAATEKELKATVGALTLPPNRGVRQQVVCVFVLFCGSFIDLEVTLKLYLIYTHLQVWSAPLQKAIYFFLKRNERRNNFCHHPFC